MLRARSGSSPSPDPDRPGTTRTVDIGRFGPSAGLPSAGDGATFGAGASPPPGLIEVYAWSSTERSTPPSSEPSADPSARSRESFGSAATSWLVPATGPALAPDFEPVPPAPPADRTRGPQDTPEHRYTGGRRKPSAQRHGSRAGYEPGAAHKHTSRPAAGTEHMPHGLAGLFAEPDHAPLPSSGPAEQPPPWRPFIPGGDPGAPSEHGHGVRTAALTALVATLILATAVTTVRSQVPRAGEPSAATGPMGTALPPLPTPRPSRTRSHRVPGGRNRAPVPAPRSPTPSPTVTTHSPTPSPPRGGVPVPLHKLFVKAQSFGPSGVRRAAMLNGRVSDDSTGFWVGCGGKPAVTDFRLGRDFARLTTILTIDTDAPSKLEVVVVLRGDGRTLARRLVTPGGEAPVDVSVDGVNKLALEAEATDGDRCERSDMGYGIAFEAKVLPA